MSSMPFVVRDSGIHGSGAFATSHIAAGSRIGEYTGERITIEESQRRFDAEESADPATYQFGLDDNWLLDGRSGGNDTRFINHGCSPNCKARVISGRVFIDALRDIEESEELLMDYHLRSHMPVSEESLAHYVCYCGSPDCRGSLLVLEPESR